MKQPEKQVELKEYLDLLQDQLRIVTDIYNDHRSLIKDTVGRDLRVHMMFPLMNSIISNGYCIGGMLVQGFLNETYMIMRAMYERCLNYCYLVCASDSDFNRYFEHAFQKNIRSLRKELIVSGFGFRLELKGHKEIWDRPSVKKLLEEYQRKISGKEIQNWSKETRNRFERLEWISKNIKDIFWKIYVFVEIMLFDESSEALHGTFFGSIFHTGYFENRIRRNGKWVNKDNVTPQKQLLIGYAAILLHTVVQAASHKRPIEESVNRSKNNVLKMAKLLEVTTASNDISDTDEIGILLPTED